MKRIACILLFLLFSLGTHATEATFSADGKTIYLSPMDAGDEIIVIDATTHKHQRVAPIPLEENDYIAALALDPSGSILLATTKSLWAWDPSTQKVQKLIAFPKNFIVDDLSCTTGNGAIPAGTRLLLGTRKEEDRFALLALLPGKKQWREVYCRRNEPYSAPRTNAAGRMFCASNFDFWECSIQPEVADDNGDAIVGSMEGCRIAPLAMMNTDSGNSGGMIVSNAVSVGSQVFCLLEGRHMGAIIQVKAPEKALYANPDGNEHPSLAKQYQLMQQCLASTKTHYDGGPCDALCAHENSPNDYKIFWRQDLENDQAWMLLSANGKAKQIGSEKSE